MSKRTFLDSADSRETSPAIMYAIYSLARGDESESHRIWADPTDDEVRVIWRWVTGGVADATDFCWGVLGPNWLCGLDLTQYIVHVRYYGWATPTPPPVEVQQAPETIGIATANASKARLEAAACGVGADVWMTVAAPKLTLA